MKRYYKNRRNMRTGDILGIEGRGWVGRAIRALTGQQWSHVAVIVQTDFDGVWVYEYVEGTGFQATPASEWILRRLGKKQTLYWGQAPEIVHFNEHKVTEFIGKFRPKMRYSYWTLLTVWWSQITRQKQPGKFVCSTFAQRCWEEAGYHDFKQLADPGDILRHCQNVTPLGEIE